ncbi:hypothetical protein D3C85_1157710 [compost metagenome]
MHTRDDAVQETIDQWRGGQHIAHRQDHGHLRGEREQVPEPLAPVQDDRVGGLPLDQHRHHHGEQRQANGKHEGVRQIPAHQFRKEPSNLVQGKSPEIRNDHISNLRSICERLVSVDRRVRPCLRQCQRNEGVNYHLILQQFDIATQQIRIADWQAVAACAKPLRLLQCTNRLSRLKGSWPVSAQNGAACGPAMSWCIVGGHSAPASGARTAPHGDRLGYCFCAHSPQHFRSLGRYRHPHRAVTRPLASRRPARRRARRLAGLDGGPRHGT